MARKSTKLLTSITIIEMKLKLQGDEPTTRPNVLNNDKTECGSQCSETVLLLHGCERRGLSGKQWLFLIEPNM